MATLARVESYTQSPDTAVHSPTTGTPKSVIDSFARAHDRACALQMIGYKNADGTYSVPSASSDATHVVRVTGRRWYDLICTCRAAGYPACTHRAIVAHGRKHGVWAARPQQANPAPTNRAQADRQAYRRQLTESDVPMPRSSERDARHTAAVAALVAAGVSPLNEAFE